jgi:predicted SprT family Zn-dependent metalloprotease
MQKIVNELYKGRTNDSGKEFKGLLKFIAGKTPKDGYFQSKVVKKRNDYTGRCGYGQQLC